MYHRGVTYDAIQMMEQNGIDKKYELYILNMWYII